MVLTTSAVSSRRPSLMGPWLMGDSRRPSSSIRFPLCSTKPTKWRSTLSSRAGVAVWPDSAAEVWADSTSLNCERSPARSRGVCGGAGGEAGRSGGGGEGRWVHGKGATDLAWALGEELGERALAWRATCRRFSLVCRSVLVTGGRARWLTQGNPAVGQDVQHRKRAARVCNWNE